MAPERVIRLPDCTCRARRGVANRSGIGTLSRHAQLHLYEWQSKAVHLSSTASYRKPKHQLRKWKAGVSKEWSSNESKDLQLGCQDFLWQGNVAEVVLSFISSIYSSFRVTYLDDATWILAICHCMHKPLAVQVWSNCKMDNLMQNYPRRKW